MSISSRWAIQRVFDMTVKDVSTDKPYVKIDDLKECNLESNQTNVYSSGGAGNAYITAHSHSKRLTGTSTASTFYNDMFALLNGTDTVTGATTIPHSEELTVNTDSATTTYIAVGTVGAEITAVYKYNADGSFGEELIQAATVAAGKFTYTSATKLLTFNADELADGSKIIVFYNVTSGASSHTITSNVNEFSKIVKIELFSLVQDACTGVEYPAIIVIPKAKLDGKITMNVGADKEPATMNTSFEALRAGCTSAKLWDLIIYDSEELS
jgi:hypothetical protein